MPHNEALSVGDVVRFGGQTWVVEFVNECRARVAPLASVKVEAGGHVFESYGEAVNISPTATLEHVPVEKLPEKEQTRAQRRVDMATTETAVAEVPVGTPSKASGPAKRKATAVKPPVVVRKAKTGRKAAKPKELSPCKCGCGNKTASHFVMGHDARFKGWLLKIERGKMRVEDLPAVVRKAYTWKRRGEGMAPTTNYKGEAHSGYGK